MKIIVDAMGGDNAPMAPVEASVRAVKELDVEIVLVGKKRDCRKRNFRHMTTLMINQYSEC